MEKEQVSQKKRGKEGLVDTLGMITYSLTAGVITDYAAGLRGVGIIASRAVGTASNIPTAAPYGKWRNFLYRKTKTTDQSSNLKKYFVEVLSFNTFQVPLYAVVVGIGSLASNLADGEVYVDMEKVRNGAGVLAAISPIVGLTVGLWMDGVRKVFGLKSAPKKAREDLETEVTGNQE